MIGITGATGKLGGQVTKMLAGAELRLRLLVRDPSRAPVLPGGDVAFIIRVSYRAFLQPARFAAGAFAANGSPALRARGLTRAGRGST